MTDGAIDNDFEEAEKTPAELLAENFKREVGDVPTHRDLGAGDLAIDLQTRQLLFVRRVVADSLVEHFEEEEFDLASYKVHPWLPVRSSDPVLECVYVNDVTVDSLLKRGTAYSFPAGRLARVPVEQAWIEDGDLDD